MHNGVIHIFVSFLSICMIVFFGQLPRSEITELPGRNVVKAFGTHCQIALEKEKCQAASPVATQENVSLVLPLPVVDSAMF